MEIVRNRDILITGLQPWEITIGSNCKNIAMELSKNNRVLYVNPPMDRISMYRKKSSDTRLDGKSVHLREVKKDLWVFQPGRMIESINQIPFHSVFGYLNRYNNRIFASEINKALCRLGFTNFIHFCDSDMFRSFHLKELLNPAMFIYYMRDNLLEVDYWRRHGKIIEPLLMAKADLVLTNSVYLAKKAAEFNKNSYFVGQGCDLENFSNHGSLVRPAEFENIPRPIIGYLGVLSHLRLDLDLINFLASSRPRWSFVFVGSEDDYFKKSNLHQLGNVYFLGNKPEAELPAYLSTFDVAINPQVLNNITRANYPRKIDEYLAMGKPVVATTTDTMVYFLNFVSLADSKEEWLLAIEKELSQNSPELADSRHYFASTHSWKKNALDIYKRIKNWERQRLAEKENFISN